jgi:flagella basal body P-ring formation protein FlgA
MNKSYYYQALSSLIAITSSFYIGVSAAEKINPTKQHLISQAERYVINQLNPDNSKTIDVFVMPIDNRVHIPTCNSALTFSSSPEALSQSNIMVKAQCQDNDWYMFMVVKANETQPVVVLSSAVSPGTLLSTDNVHVVNMNKKRLRTSTFADIQDVIGARIKRRVTAGRPVNPKNLCYVCKGDRVIISAGTVNMLVKTSGIALEDGNMGETIKVKNRRSSKKVYARVTSTGQVAINL